MKNIHIIPTNKPSRFWVTNLGNLARCQDVEPIKKALGNNININITSNEEIKEGVDQWYIDKVLNKPYNSGGAQYSSKQDVIVLTTDQDLIKNGVEAIDDEFLEWYTNGLCTDVFQDEDGVDLEEYIESKLNQ